MKNGLEFFPLFSKIYVFRHSLPDSSFYKQWFCLFSKLDTNFRTLLSVVNDADKWSLSNGEEALTYCSGQRPWHVVKAKGISLRFRPRALEGKLKLQGSIAVIVQLCFVMILWCFDCLLILMLNSEKKFLEYNIVYLLFWMDFVNL